jgi:hypothetical protein
MADRPAARADSWPAPPHGETLAMNRRSVLRVVLLGALCLVLAGGCGSRGGTVRGKVTRKGKPVVWGTVTLIGSDGVQYAGQLTPEGTYSIPGVPGGPVKIAVSSPNPDGSSRGGPAAANAGTGDGPAPEALANRPPAGAWIRLPEKYSDPQKSGLTGTVNSDTVIDIDLP